MDPCSDNSFARSRGYNTACEVQMCKGTMQRRITVSAAKQGCCTRTSAAVLRMMMMDVRINKANETMMTEILRKKKMMTMR